jgi:hypothetical protein
VTYGAANITKLEMTNYFISPNTLTFSVLMNPSNSLTQAAYPFPTIEDLLNRKIIGIEVFCDIDVPFDPNNSGVPVVDVNMFKGAFLTLYTSSNPGTNVPGSTQQPGLFYDKLPFSSLRRVRNANTSVSYSDELFLIRPTFLVLNKSKVEFPTPVTLTSPQSALVQVHYLDENDMGTKYMM